MWLLTMFLICCWLRVFKLYRCIFLCWCALHFLLFLFLFLFMFMLHFVFKSSSHCFSLFDCAIILSHCCLFASISKANFSTSGSSLSLWLFSIFILSTIFLLPLSYMGLLLLATFFVAPYGAATLSVASHLLPLL